MFYILLIAVLVFAIYLSYWIFKSYSKVTRESIPSTPSAAKSSNQELPGKFLPHKTIIAGSKASESEDSYDISNSETITESNSQMSTANFDGINENPAHPDSKSVAKINDKENKLLEEAKKGHLNDIANESVLNQPYDKSSDTD